MAKKHEKETKKILQGVVFHDITYLPGDEDDLEERLTKENYERLMEQDPPPLSGDWSPAGSEDDEEPMVGSAEWHAARGTLTPHPTAPSKSASKRTAERRKRSAERKAARAEKEADEQAAAAAE